MGDPACGRSVLLALIRCMARSHLMFEDVLDRLGLRPQNSGVFARGWVESPGGRPIESINPATGEAIARVSSGSVEDYARVVEEAERAFWKCRSLPPPVPPATPPPSRPR